jgi:hypothetical protein
MAEKPSEDLSFTEWCGRFLRTVLQIQGTSSSISSNGIPVDEISQVIFGELVKEPGFSESTRGLAILLARKELHALGMAHTVGRDVILITQNLDDVPFDLRHHRVIVYENTPDGADLLVESLRKTITSVLGERI